jgi:hypothetical protein
MDIAVSSTTSCRLQTSAPLACLLITSVQTPISPCLVGILYKFQVLLADSDPVLGWSLFVAAAMTSNLGLLSELILRVLNGTAFVAGKTTVVYYDSAKATPLQGVLR